MPDTTIYISGPMTGIPEFNYPMFAEYTKKYREKGYKVISPAETDGGDTSKPWSYYLRKDVRMLVDDVDAVYMLPGWQKSKGARLEFFLASELGIPIFDAVTGEKWNETVAQEAHRLVHGDRGEQYGHPIFDLTRSADIFTAIIRKKLRPGVRLEAEDMALGMVGIKLSREVFCPKRDNRVDAAGYAEVTNLCAEWRQEHPGVDPRDVY